MLQLKKKQQLPNALIKYLHIYINYSILILIIIGLRKFYVQLAALNRTRVNV